MDIGKPKRIYTVEPIEAPIPRTVPEKEEPAAPQPTPPAEPGRVATGD